MPSASTDKNKVNRFHCSSKKISVASYHETNKEG